MNDEEILSAYAMSVLTMETRDNPNSWASQNQSQYLANVIDSTRRAIVQGKDTMDRIRQVVESRQRSTPRDGILSNFRWMKEPNQ